MKISKRTREQAALICQIAASDQSRTTCSCHVCIGFDLGVSTRAQTLAFLAQRHALNTHPTGFDLYDAEAESLLRTGWEP